jgi:hypothetical protein
VKYPRIILLIIILEKNKKTLKQNKATTTENYKTNKTKQTNKRHKQKFKRIIMKQTTNRNMVPSCFVIHV